MKRALSSATIAFVLGLCLALAPSPVASGEPADDAPAVDFRMTPLEQAVKIHQQASTRTGSRVTITVMNGWRGDATEDRSHLIVNERTATRSYLRDRLLNGRVDSVSWSTSEYDSGFVLNGACDSESECQRKADELCAQAGHGGVKKPSVTVTIHADGSKTCSGDCQANGAVAFVTCNPSLL